MVVGVDRCDRWNVPPLFDEVIAADADEEDGDEQSHQDDSEYNPPIHRSGRFLFTTQ